MSNVRDERLFRTFRDGKVKFFQPGTQKGDWFNLMSVHQNHHAYTETGYLPENFLPEFLDLVIWGHEHECLIEPRYNPETTFHVMQPGSSVATSLMPGEAVPKHVAILTITGKEFKSEPIRLKTVRPFVMKEIVLADEKAMKNVWKNDNNRPQITKHLVSIVDSLIAQARRDWLELQDGDSVDPEKQIPLVRLRVEYTAPEGGRFDCENPQRFSNRFVEKVANVNDVVQFYRKKRSTTRKGRDAPDMPEESVMAQLSLDTVKVEKLVREFLTAQSLTILPQNSFGDAVSQFVDKDDKHAMETFVNESLSDQIKHLLATEENQDNDLSEAIDKYRSQLEDAFAAGSKRKANKIRARRNADEMDSDMDGAFNITAGPLRSNGEAEAEADDDIVSAPAKAMASRGQGKATASTRKPVAAPKEMQAATNGRGVRKLIDDSDDDEEDGDVVMISDNNDDDEDDDEDNDEDGGSQLFVKPAKPPARKPASKPAAKSTAAQPKNTPAKPPARASTTGRQSKLNFSQPSSQVHQRAQTSNRPPRKREPSPDEISDDEDAFEPMVPARATRSKR